MTCGPVEAVLFFETSMSNTILDGVLNSTASASDDEEYFQRMLLLGPSGVTEPGQAGSAVARLTGLVARRREAAHAAPPVFSLRP